MDAIAYAKASSAYKLAKQVETGLTNKVSLGGSSIVVPVGTTATRPTLGAGESAIRYNSDVGGLEEWTGVEWKNISADISAVTLKGTDTEVNILAKVGMVAEDLWIASDTLDGWVYDGLVWINIGPLQGPQGVQGIQGIQGIQGEVGPQGIQGIQGEIGHQGIQGIQGIQGETGPKGDNGDTGAQGIQGIQGEIGLQGIQGPIGETGPQGPIGETGAGLVVKGTDTVANILLKSGVEGDFWIASDTGDGYSYVSGSWVNTGQIRGPQGEQGDQGTQGETGPQGVTGNGIASIIKTGTVGLVDTYTAYADLAETQPLGSFDVYNGADITNVNVINDTQTTLTNTWSASKIATNKQDMLISGTSIKTVNGVSVLGSGDLSTIQTTITGNSGTATTLQTARTINGVSFDGSANITVSDATAVKLTGNQTIDDIKTFTSSPIVPAPTTNTQAANKGYVDSIISNVQALPIGAILNGYTIFGNCVVAFGGEFNRADYPKLWAYLQANPTLVKTQAQWTTESTTNGGICGFFSDGNGTTTFRVPNLDKAFLRPDNRAVASYQSDAIRNITGTYSNKIFRNDSNAEQSATGAFYQTSSSYGSAVGSGAYGTWSPLTFDASRVVPASTENRPKNIAVLPLIVAK